MGEGRRLAAILPARYSPRSSLNPSNIEQRTGRIDRLGCKAEGKESIVVYFHTWQARPTNGSIE